MTKTNKKLDNQVLTFGSGKLSVPDESYNHINFDASILDSLSRINFPSIYIIDYHRQNFFYVNSNPLFLCGCRVEEVKAMGYDFYYRHVIEQEHQLLIDINKAGFEFYEQNICIENRLSCSISYDFHLTCRETPVLVNHQLTPWKLTDDGDIWLALCVVSFSSSQNSGNVIITCHDTGEQWALNLDNLKWVKNKRYSLTDREKAVLRLSGQGMNTKEIATLLCKSPLTIKEYRKAIFSKLGVNKISEAIIYCQIHQLI